MCNSTVIKHRKQLMVISLFMTLFFVAVSTPWSWGNTFFADSPAAWWIYYVVGTGLSFYVSWIFLRSLVILLNHEKHHIIGCHD